MPGKFARLSGRRCAAVVQVMRAMNLVFDQAGDRGLESRFQAATTG
jgi:hypothetical protein